VQLRQNTEIIDFFEALKSLQQLGVTCSNLLEKEKIGEIGPTDAVFELEIVSYDTKGIEPGRLSRIIFTLTNLYTNLAHVLGVQDTNFTFKYFDSGSGLRVGIEGVDKVIESINTLLLQWWDKIRFRDFDTFDKRLEAVSKSLTVMTTVQESVKNGVINAETGENLKRRICQGADRLIGLGAALPVKKDAEIDEEQLLIEKRDVKLLGTGQPSDPDDQDRS
jgi:hypothetical protein